MTTRLQKLRLGIFMLLAFLILFGSVAVLAGLKLWNPHDRFYVRFHESISGLEVGSTVKMKGVRVGQVDRISIAKDVESVIVTLSLDPGTPITVDTRAIMTSFGITGIKFVELTGGSARSTRIPPNTQTSIIKSGSSALESLTGKATDIALKMEGLLNNMLRLTSEENRVRVTRVLDNADRLVTTWEQVASTNKDRIRSILRNVDQTTAMMEKASAGLARVTEENAGALKETLTSAAGAARSLRTMIQSLQPQDTLTAINKAADSIRRRIDDPSITKALGSLDVAASKATKLAGELEGVVRQRDRQLTDIMRSLDTAAAHLKEFARAIKERPSLLLRGETHKERDVP